MSNGHIPSVRNPGPSDVDWSHAPEGATHFCTRRRLWYGKGPGGAWYYMEPFNEKYGWLRSILGPKQLDNLVPRPVEPTDNQGQVICPECHGNGFVHDHSGEVDPAKAEGTSEKVEQAERPETKAAPPSVPLSVDVTLFAEAINYSLGDAGKAYANLARELENVSYEQAAGRLDRRQFPAPGYERLHDVYQDAHHQAAYGKGNERHANDLPFHEQRMQTISQGLNSPDGMAYQVIKKLQEGLQMEDPGARRRELLGALNYLAGIVIFLDDREAGGDA